MLRFAWNERKNRSNRLKHGVWFEEAQSAFDDRSALLFEDTVHSDQEQRFILIGVSSAARTLVVAHCYREGDSLVRIIGTKSHQEGTGIL